MTIGEYISGPFPCWYYHASKPPVYVTDAVQAGTLGEGYSRTYVAQQYPKAIPDGEGGIKIVASPEEENAAPAAKKK